MERTVNKMLIQLGYEDIETNDFEMCEQREVKSARDMGRFLSDVKEGFPPKKGFRYVAIKEGSDKFLMEAARNGV